MREAEDELDQIDAEDDGDEIAADVAQKSESRIAAFAKKYMSEDDGTDEVDIPPPPADVTQEDDDMDDDDDVLTDDDGEPVPPMEAKLARSVKRLVRENKKLRYERKVTEMIAGKAIAGVVRRSKSRPVAEATVEVNGKQLSVDEAAEVIRELSKMVRESRRDSRSRVSESVEDQLAEDRPVLRSTARMSDRSRLSERLSEPDYGTSLMESQANLGAALAKRIGGK